MAITVTIIATVPLDITAVQMELVKQHHAYYDSITGKFILKECK